MWIVYALIAGVFVICAVTAGHNGQTNFAVAFGLLACLYAWIGVREARGKNG
jgi:hypothetical protein